MFPKQSNVSFASAVATEAGIGERVVSGNAIREISIRSVEFRASACPIHKWTTSRTWLGRPPTYVRLAVPAPDHRRVHLPAHRPARTRRLVRGGLSGGVQ